MKSANFSIMTVPTIMNCLKQKSTNTGKAYLVKNRQK
jgi:hypothetical protein